MEFAVNYGELMLNAGCRESRRTSLPNKLDNDPRSPYLTANNNLAQATWPLIEFVAIVSRVAEPFAGVRRILRRTLAICCDVMA